MLRRRQRGELIRDPLKALAPTFFAVEKALAHYASMKR